MGGKGRLSIWCLDKSAKFPRRGAISGAQYGPMTPLLLSLLAVALTLAAFTPYIRAILRGTIRPHLFSWIIWGAATLVVFSAQLADGGGIGAWPIGLSGMITVAVAYLVYHTNPTPDITRMDWLLFTLAMSALPLWYFTTNPLWAVVLMTAIDLTGFGPTLRKSFARPFEEGLTPFVLMALRNGVVIGALAHHSVTTVLFPAATGLACVLVIVLVLLRRRQVAKTHRPTGAP